MGNRRPLGVAVVVVSAGVQLCGAGFGCEVVQQRVPRAVGGDRGDRGRERSRGVKERRKAIVEVDEEYNFVDSEVFYYFTTTSLE